MPHNTLFQTRLSKDEVTSNQREADIVELNLGFRYEIAVGTHLDDLVRARCKIAELAGEREIVRSEKCKRLIATNAYIGVDLLDAYLAILGEIEISDMISGRVTVVPTSTSSSNVPLMIAIEVSLTALGVIGA